LSEPKQVITWGSKAEMVARVGVEEAPGMSAVSKSVLLGFWRVVVSSSFLTRATPVSMSLWSMIIGAPCTWPESRALLTKRKINLSPSKPATSYKLQPNRARGTYEGEAGPGQRVMRREGERAHVCAHAPQTHTFIHACTQAYTPFGNRGCVNRPRPSCSSFGAPRLTW
jgi:hypothetical protein